MEYILFCVWFLLLIFMLERFIHTFVCSCKSFSLPLIQPKFCDCITIGLTILLFMGHFVGTILEYLEHCSNCPTNGCSNFCLLTDTFAVNILIHVFWWTYAYISRGCMPWNLFAGLQVMHMFNFSSWYTVVVSVYYPTSGIW